jgi:hypothetical protein
MNRDIIEQQSTSTPHSEMIARYGAWTLLAAAFVAVVACCCLLDFTKLLRNTNDDAYYYFKISENVAKGEGTTFDGIHKTSGFQPLWMLVLVPVLWICPDAPETALRAGLGLQAFLLLAAGALVILVQSKLFSWKAVLASVVCYTFLVFFRATNGLESAALVLALMTLFAYVQCCMPFAGGANSVFKEFVFGILLGVVMLARLDTVFLGASVIAFRAWPVLTRSPGWRRAFVGSLTILTGASLVVAPYLLYNYVTLGKMVPISGGLKSSFPHISLSLSDPPLHRLGLARMLLMYAIVAWALIYVVWYLLFLRRTAKGARFYYHTCMAVFGCGIALHFVHSAMFMKWAIMAWHFFPYLLFCSLAVAGLVEKLLSSAPRRAVQAAYWSATLGLVVLGVWGNYNRSLASDDLPCWQITSYAAAVFAREHTDPSDVFALKDTGNFGYFSRRRVINLDGLVNDWEYQEVLKRQTLNAYFRENRVKYLVLHSVKDHPRVLSGEYDSEAVTYRSQLCGTMSDPIIVRKRNEVYRSKYCDELTWDAFVIWDVSRDPDSRDSF